ncbi:MAG: hypothetical protein II797_00620 [Clostridia bacterium]|nr:hypothetical protein [Clostridia bacterium]
MMNKIRSAMTRLAVKIQNCRGDGYVDSGIKILIAVVIGSLLLTSLYGVFNTDIIPVLKEKIAELFAYTV